jgi:hypothetical protein
MLSLLKVTEYIKSNEDTDVLKAYYDKCSDNLKDLNQKSNWQTRLITLILVFYLFPKEFKTLKLFDIEFDIKLIRLLTSTVLSYCIFEWLMIAKRRRDLTVALQQITYRIFKINPSKNEEFFPAFNPNTLNIMPFSLMNEIVTIDRKRRFNLYLIRIALGCLFVFLLTVIILSLYETIKSYQLQWHFVLPQTTKDFIDIISLYVSLIISLLFLTWIVYYYIIEFKNLAEIKALTQNAQAE